MEFPGFSIQDKQNPIFSQWIRFETNPLREDSFSRYSVNDTKRVFHVQIPIKTRNEIKCPYEQRVSQFMACQNRVETHLPLLKTALTGLLQENGAQRLDKRNAFPLVSKNERRKTDLSLAETL